MADVPSISFTVILADEGAIPVSFDPRALFGRARPPVVVAIEGHSYRSTIAIMSGATFVPLRRSHREAAGVRRGDAVRVTLSLDTAPREVEVPADVAERLATTGLREAWDRLSYSHQREHAEAIEGAKTPETRARRIETLTRRLGKG